MVSIIKEITMFEKYGFKIVVILSITLRARFSEKRVSFPRLCKAICMTGDNNE